MGNRLGDWFMAVGRRELLKNFGIGALAAASATQVGMLLSPLEALAQPARQSIGKFSDGFSNLEIIEMYSDGMFLAQSADFGEYSARVSYFVRKGAAGEFSDWSVRSDLYKKGNSAPVNSMKVNGTLQGGKMTVTNTIEADKKITIESSLTQAAYEQSSMFQLSRVSETEVAKYLGYLPYAIQSFRKDAKPMPPGYNPLK